MFIFKIMKKEKTIEIFGQFDRINSSVNEDYSTVSIFFRKMQNMFQERYIVYEFLLRENIFF